MATMIGNFQDGRKQYGAAWWFLDQKDGIERQPEAAFEYGAYEPVCGMLTDSRSFLSFPRHEYFRRILCNVIAADVENGLLPPDFDWLGQVIGDICFHNACRVFLGWSVPSDEANAMKKSFWFLRVYRWFIWRSFTGFPVLQGEQDVRVLRLAHSLDIFVFQFITDSGISG